MYFVFIAVSAVVCSIFIHNATYSKKKYTSLDFYQLSGCALIAVLTTFIIIYYIQPNYQVLICFGVALFWEELSQGMGMVINIPNINKININNLYNPAPGAGAQNTAPAPQNPSPAPQNALYANVTRDPTVVSDPRPPGLGRGDAYNPHANPNSNINRYYAIAIELAIRRNCWNGGPVRPDVLDNLDPVARQFYFD